MRKLVLLICIIVLWSCSGKKGFYKYSKNHPEALAKECADKFPPLQKFLPGKVDTVKGKTIIIKGDSIPCPQSKEDKQKGIPPKKTKAPDKKFKCPDSFICTPDTVIQTDSAVLFLNAKQKQTIQLQVEEIKELKSKNTSLILTCIILGLGLIAMIYFWIRK